MKSRKELIPVMLLGSGAALTVCGLAGMVAYGPKTPFAFFVLMLAGVLDGAAGLIWTVAVLFSRGVEEGADETGRKLILASGLMSVIFLGAVLALLMYLHVIVSCLKSWRLF